MKAEIEELLNDLRSEGAPAANIDKKAKMVVIDEDTEERHEFTGEETFLLLANPKTVQLFFEALEYPLDTFVEVTGVTLSRDVLAALEEYAETVDIL